MIDQFRERNFILSLYGGNVYGFVHRAFLEYFCATAFTYKFEKIQEITLQELIQNVYDKHWEDLNWHEVLRLICVMLNERFAGSIISYLAKDLTNYNDSPKEGEPLWNIALAVQCLGEVRNLNQVREPARYTLQAICWIYDYLMNQDPTIEDFVESEIMPSVELIGSNWPSRSLLKNWLKERGECSAPFFQAELFGRFVGSIGAGLEEVHQAVLTYAWDINPTFRVLAPYALLKGWRDDPHTVSLLTDLANDDPDPYVRRVAISALAEYYRSSPQTLGVLLDHAASHPSVSIRCDAISALAEYYNHCPEALSLITEYGVNDDDEIVRAAALTALAKAFHDNEQTLVLLRDRARNDPSAKVRSVALSALGSQFSNNIDNYYMLSDIALNDNDQEVRSAALLSLAKSYPDDPRTLGLLRKQAIADRHGFVRISCISALAEYFPDDSETLVLIRGRATRDSDEKVRAAAISIIADYFSSDPQSLKLVIDRAKKDPSPRADDEPNSGMGYVRQIAIQSLARVWPTESETLSILYRTAENDRTDWLREVALDLLAELSRESDNDRMEANKDEESYRMDGRKTPELFLQEVLDLYENVTSEDTDDEEY